MNGAPLSTLLAHYYSWQDDASYYRFVVEFSRSVVGVVCPGAPEGVTGRIESTDENALAVGLSVTPDGRSVLLTFADPAVFTLRYGGGFNAVMDGMDVFKTVEANPSCKGVQVNSALSEISVIITREAALSMLGSEAATNKPWWKFWL